MKREFVSCQPKASGRQNNDITIEIENVGTPTTSQTNNKVTFMQNQQYSLPTMANQEKNPDKRFLGKLVHKTERERREIKGTLRQLMHQ